MDNQNKNLILATVLSFLVILVWFVLFPPEEPAFDPVSELASGEDATMRIPPAAPQTGGLDVPPEAATPAEAPRVAIDTPRLSGSISLLGGRIDDLSLRDYRETLDPDSDIVHLFTPARGTRGAYYALHGWRPGASLTFDNVPGANTLWESVGNATLSPGRPVTLRWDNGTGLIFQRVIEVDDNYLFTITQRVENRGDTAVRLAPYGLVERHGLPEGLTNFFILHEGLVQMSDGQLNEDSYSKMTDYAVVEREATRALVTEVDGDGWIGFTDKYWMATLIPEGGQGFTSVARYVAGSDVYQTRADMPAVEVAAGGQAESVSMLFAGAKEWSTIRAYEHDGIDRFLDSIDWGWLFFLTKPIFAVLHWLNAIVGNMGWSIIGLTFLIKAVLFPLAYKSYVSMARMKELQPEMEALKERAGGDKQKLQQEMMKLYKEKKINPAAGCLPILLQIPIFFSLYKVIFVTIELRHAPWLGWIRDLSAPDPSSILNLFGLLPWSVPEQGGIMALVFIGIMPIFLGVSMWMQQKLNPAPTDPTQKMIFAWMPWVFMFMLGSFASGLVLYWITNNVITFAQQYIIMRTHGHRPDLFGNIRSSFSQAQGGATTADRKQGGGSGHKPAEKPAANASGKPGREPEAAPPADNGDTPAPKPAPRPRPRPAAKSGSRPAQKSAPKPPTVRSGKRGGRRGRTGPPKPSDK